MERYPILFFVVGFFIFFDGILAENEVVCDYNKINACLNKLDTFLKLDNLTFVDSDHELDTLCDFASFGERCATDFLVEKKCVSPQNNIKTPIQIRRAKFMFDFLCKRQDFPINATFRTEFLHDSSCIRNHDSKIKHCYKTSEMPEDVFMITEDNGKKTEDVKYRTACCPVEKFSMCSKMAIQATCGEKSGQMVSDVITSVSGRQMGKFCHRVDSTYPVLSKTCVAVNSSPVLLPKTLLHVLLLIVSVSLMFQNLT